MKKVFICIPTLASAGAERFATELACNLDIKKFKTFVIITKKLDIESAFYIKLREAAITIYDVSSSNYLIEVGNIRSLMKKENPDIIHTNVGATLHMLLPQILCGRRVKHICTAHSMGYRLFGGFKRIIISFCFQQHMITPVAISDTVKKSIIDTFNLEQHEVELVYNGVDTNYFNKSTDNSNDIITIVTVGTLYHIKNHELLIDAFAEAHETLKNIRLLIVGNGELKEFLEIKVDTLGLKDAVSFAGNQSDVKSFLDSADIYCCTSKVEGLPIAVLEAMACKLPIISTPAGGVVDIVKNNCNGYLVGFDKSEIARKIVELAINKQLRKQMGENSRRLALEHDIKVCAANYEKLYLKLCKR